MLRMTNNGCEDDVDGCEDDIDGEGDVEQHHSHPSKAPKSTLVSADHLSISFDFGIEESF